MQKVESAQRISQVQNGESVLTPVGSMQSDRPQPSKLLPAAITGAVFLKALERLCSSKNTVQLTPHASETWVSALSIYADRPQIVNKAVIQMATSEDSFPDLGKLLAACERIRRETDGTMPQDSSKVKFTNIAQLAAAWGLEV